MSDLPPLELSNMEKENIFKELDKEESEDLDVWKEGDVSVGDIANRYGITFTMARKRMNRLIKKYPHKYCKVLVILPGSFQNRRGHVIRALETQLNEVPRQELAQLLEAVPKES